MAKTEFNSKKELDNVFQFIAENGNAQKPSEIMRFYTELENKLIAIYQKGYSKGVEINIEIKKITDKI